MKNFRGGFTKNQLEDGLPKKKGVLAVCQFDGGDFARKKEVMFLREGG